MLVCVGLFLNLITPRVLREKRVNKLHLQFGKLYNNKWIYGCTRDRKSILGGSIKPFIQI